MPFGLREMGSISRFPANTIRGVEKLEAGGRGGEWNTMARIVAAAYALRLWGTHGKSRIRCVQVYALSRLGYKTEAVISSVAPAHPTSPLRCVSL